MEQVAAVLFDLFGTLIHFHRDRLPLVHLNGTSLRSTSGALYAYFGHHHPQIDFGTFHRSFTASAAEVERRRIADGCEVDAATRFALLYEELGLPVNGATAAERAALLTLHMETLAGSVEFPESYRPVLSRLAARFPLALVSNFDHAPTACGILERVGIASMFRTTLISATVGECKPRPGIFLRACHDLGLPPTRAVFVGDCQRVDVLGAKGVGMQVIWVNRDGVDLHAGVPRPDHTVSDLTEIEPLLA
ncbi:MAG: HAD family hydrolase [Candidatus Methylomirabilales bacterium]